MRHILPPVLWPRAIVLRASPPPPNEPPPNQPNQQTNAQGQPQQQSGPNRSVIIGIIVAILLLLLLACVALAPGFLAKRNPTTSVTPTPTTNPFDVTPTVTTTPVHQPGLSGAYYRMPTYQAGSPVPAMPTGTPVFTAVDANIDVPLGVWGVNGSQHYPHPELGNLGPHGFAIRWTGFIQPSTTGTYMFSAIADDGVRVWVNNQLLIDNWTVHAHEQSCSVVASPGTPVATPSSQCTTISLTSGQFYSIKVEYYENYVGDATIQFMWQSPTMTQPAIVPASALFH